MESFVENYTPPPAPPAVFVVCWTGKFPNLCSGKWIIVRNGINVSGLIPEHLRNSPMNTRKEYPRWSINARLQETWCYYTDGLSAKDWISENRSWIQEICNGEKEKLRLYHAINAQDWRHGSCGGCI